METAFGFGCKAVVQTSWSQILQVVFFGFFRNARIFKMLALVAGSGLQGRGRARLLQYLRLRFSGFFFACFA